ncbi:Mur ligase family protein [Virgibacillus sp. 179-BFC.A HS]|uniref:tetrahydrofolate synthase n=1 Tax=Tigheibacillus jepli TaxID=3035914 RepID=A0ABU5CGK5_9BACI|nr:Mur ligase family protein [Virgibacillus sp. 179-BFC.A HS]MDY0405444.1 Mur ligase family protein [Virgibacillus sp. 179-BFC.A HS]
MFTTFADAEKFLRNRQSLGIKPGLDRIHQLLDFLGHPESRVSGIHIAGTNGKGSTVQFLKEALMENGYRVGTFTSPSMYGINGHITDQNQSITKDAFRTLLGEMLPAIQKMDDAGMAPTPFEIMTALAFYFFDKHVEIAIIEAGMGGKEDTTNCFTPILSIITNVALDHMAFLGDTPAKIAAHKAGIIKQHIPVVAGEMDPTAKAVVMDEANKKQAACYFLHDTFHYDQITRHPSGQSFRFVRGQSACHVSLRMKGEHQIKNASLALMALKLLKKKGFNVEKGKSLHALQSAELAGRFECLHENPVIIADSAHNPAGMKAFLQTVHDNYSDIEKQLVFAGFRDKDLKHMLADCIGKFSCITLTSFDHPRAITAAELAAQFPNESMLVVEDYRKVMQHILQDNNGNPYYFIAGSFHFIAEIREYLQSQFL